jgi:hypothetical protein
MEDYLYQKDIFLPLGGKAKQAMSMKDEEWEVLDRKALGMIRLCLATSMDFNISKENTTEDMMKDWINYMKNPHPPTRYF